MFKPNLAKTGYASGGHFNYMKKILELALLLLLRSQTNWQIPLLPVRRYAFAANFVVFAFDFGAWTFFVQVTSHDFFLPDYVFYYITI